MWSSHYTTLYNPITSSYITGIEKTKRALEIAYSGFDNVTEPDLIDCYIYEVNAIMKRYQFLMAQADLLSSNPQTAETSLIAEALH